MQNAYYYDNSSVNKFNDLCYDLISRRRFYDLRSYSILVVDQIFKSATTDLCELSAKSVDLPKFEHLIGIKSEVFKQLCEDDRLFHHFLYSLGTHCMKFRMQFDILYESVYFWYFNSVLTYLLPDNDSALVYLKKLDWFCAINKHSATKSALRLLKPQVIAASYSPDLFARTDGFQSLYPRTFDFTKFMIEYLSDRTAVPYEGQIVTLKHMVLYYIRFLLTSTNDADFNSFKEKLRSLNWVTYHVKPFLVRWLQNRALDDMYTELVDFWTCLIAPDDSLKSREQYTKFYQMFTKDFGDIFFIIMDRCLIADLSITSHIKFLSYVVENVFSTALISWYQKLGYPVEDKMTQIQSKVFNYQQAVENDIKEKQKVSSQNKVAAFFGIVQNIVSTPPEHVKDLKRILDLLSTKLGGKEPSLSASALQLPNTSNTSGKISNISSNDSTLSTSFRPLANSTPVRKTPDYHTDPVTKLHHLTSEGRIQVLRRQACFDFSQCALTMSRISPHAGPLENEFMVKLMLFLSEEYSDSKFTRYLRVNNGRTWPATILSKIFLANPYANRYVPIYTRNAVKPLPQLNLRFMASYPFIVISALVLWVLISFIIGILF
uniref:Uncharacterized protein n=1 Tax=Panagrolaimus sp. PS1159 TaxID=55785 RepID=A0AC35GYR9_9BILA